jgi:hypothetical protein
MPRNRSGPGRRRGDKALLVMAIGVAAADRARLCPEALRQAIEELKIVAEISEPDRDVRKIDHDPSRASGAGPMLEILNLIDRADVVVADVTAVGRIGSGADIQPESAGNRLINSNVGVELGYALRALTGQRLITVFNSHYGWQEDPAVRRAQPG